MWFLHVERNKDQKKKKSHKYLYLLEGLLLLSIFKQKNWPKWNRCIYNNLIICVYIDDEFGEIEYNNHMLMT